MRTDPDKHVHFQKIKQALAKFGGDGIIDLDKRLREIPDFQVYRLEDLLDYVGLDLPPCRQTPYSMTLIREGSGEICIGQYTLPVRDNTLFIVPGRTVHSGKYLSANCRGYVLCFSMDFMLNNVFSQQGILGRRVFGNAVKPSCTLSSQDMHIAVGIFGELFKIIDEDRSAGREKLAIKILEWLIFCDQIVECGEKEDNSRHHPVVERFMELLSRTFMLERGVQYYADALNVHPNYLNFLLKKNLGLSAKECIDRRLITESKYLLINPSLRIKEVAYKLGFDDPNNFSTFFQKHAGSSPLKYRSSRIRGSL